MERVSALVLYVLGYTVIALLEPAVAALPAFAAFAAGGMLIVRRWERPDPAEAVARELLERR